MSTIARAEGCDPLRAALAGVTAAVLTPFDASGRPRPDAVADYARSLAKAGVSALAVAAHTGRGPHLSDEVRLALVSEYRAASGLPVVAGVGLPPDVGLRSDAERADIVVAQARQVASAGADGLLCFPIPRVHHDGRDGEEVVALHERLASETGLPVVAFVLYEAASGHAYDAQLVARLTEVPGVVAIKVATLEDAVTSQDLIGSVRRGADATLAITGEDRMFGPSLMWGAEGALVGLAAALPAWTVAVHNAWREGRHADFVAASARLDRFAGMVFRAPMEGYVQRMAWVAGWEGSLPAHLCTDPFGPEPAPGEKESLLRALDVLAAVESSRV